MIHLTTQFAPLGERSPTVALTVAEAVPISVPGASSGIILKKYVVQVRRFSSDISLVATVALCTIFDSPVP